MNLDLNFIMEIISVVLFLGISIYGVYTYRKQDKMFYPEMFEKKK